MLDSSSGDEESDSASPASPPRPANDGHHGFIFGYSSDRYSLQELHPPPEQISYLWQVYLSSVDPLLKVSHVPTTHEQILRAEDDLENVPRAIESLMFSIYFASVTSMSNEQCVEMLGEERSILVDKYWFATEQALARAGFLNTTEIVVLQAFVLFLVRPTFIIPPIFSHIDPLSLSPVPIQLTCLFLAIRSVSAATMVHGLCGR